MSRAYDAKQHVLEAYPDDRGAAISLFLDYIDMGEGDFKYEFDETPEEYIFGSIRSDGEG
jgi:hypothetical protein